MFSALTATRNAKGGGCRCKDASREDAIFLLRMQNKEWDSSVATAETDCHSPCVFLFG